MATEKEKIEYEKTQSIKLPLTSDQLAALTAEKEHHQNCNGSLVNR